MSMKANRNLPKMILASGTPTSLARALHTWQQKSHKDSNNCNYGKKLDQGIAVRSF
jgi:hypothetical protein